jgi:dihydrofolate reductase
MRAAQPLVSLIVAMAQNGVIGRGNTLPWRLPDDLRRFKEFTLGKTLLMGRKTFESIGHPLPALTRTTGGELVAIGGAEIYRLVLPFARRIYLTHVHADVPGDTYFPEFDPLQWADVEYLAHPADERHAYPMTFVTLERRYLPEAPRR